MITWTEKSRACPSPETVRKYLEGWTDEASAQQIEEHLSLCDVCASSVEPDRNPSDHWLQAIRSKTHPIPSEAIQSDRELLSEELDPVAQQAIERSKRMLQYEGASALPIREKPFSNSVSALGEIGPYELIRPIGQGGMGYVMLARHKHLDKEVAVKILPSTPWRVPSEEARFQREVRAVGKLEHPSIVTALDAGEFQGTHFLAMEYVDGLDLSRLTKALGTLSISDACELIRQTALGLSYAHAQGIVHRDVKPSNLMLDRSGRIKILDFGLAQLQPWDDGCADLTSVGQLMGTLDYMAPEQAEHGGTVSYRADLYSLGATLFRLLVGRAALAITPTQTPIEKLRLLSNHPIPHLKTMLPDAPDGLCSIVDSLLARDPSQRPPSAAHLAELLEPWAKGADLVNLLKSAQAIATQAPESLPSNPSLLVSQRIATASRVGTSTLPRTQSSRARNHWNWILWTAAGLLVPLAAFGGFLIYLETQKGQVVVESEVAEVRVRVVSDGKEIDDIQLSQGANSIRLRAGKYELFIESPTDSITMTNQAFVLKKGETIVARIRRAEQQVGQTSLGTPSMATSSSSPNAPLYDGKSLQEWLAILDRERAISAVNESLAAIKGLATKEDRELIRKPLDALIQRFSDNGAIIFQALEIEKKIGSDDEFENRWRAILSTTQQGALVQLLGNNLEKIIQNNRMFAESLMSLEVIGMGPELRNRVSTRLIQLFRDNSDFTPDELSRYVALAFSSESARTVLVDPTRPMRVEVLLKVDELVLRLLQSQASTPSDNADAMRYMLNAKSLTRVRKDAVVAIEKILIAMSKDGQLRSAETQWHGSSDQMIKAISERGREYNSMFGGSPSTIPYSIFVLRFISAANLTADLAQPLRELAQSCLISIQPIAPELLALKMNRIDMNSWDSDIGIYSLKSKPLVWKKDFFTFHAALRLLQSNKLADIKDFLPGTPTSVDVMQWRNAASLMSQLDTDRSGDLDKDEFEKAGDFAVADKDGDGSLAEVELYRYRLDVREQDALRRSASDILTLVTALNAYQRNHGAFPNTLQALWTKPDDSPTEWAPYLKLAIVKDPWGTLYDYTPDGPKFRIRSNGPDRQENTEDDISNLE